MSRRLRSPNRNIAKFLGKTEVTNTTDTSLATLNDVSGVGGGSLTVYDSIGTLPLSSVTEGSMAFVNSNSRMYVHNGTGWYSATIVNTTPTWDSGGQPVSTYIIEDSATPLVISLSASDPEGVPLSWSGTADDSAQYLMDISNSGGTYTFTPKTAQQVWNNVTAGYLDDSAGGAINYTFKASDGINILSSTAQISYVGLLAYALKPTTEGTAWGNSNTAMTDAYNDGGSYTPSYNSSTYKWTYTHTALFDGMNIIPNGMVLPNMEWLCVLYFNTFSSGFNDRGSGALHLYNTSGTFLNSLGLSSGNTSDANSSGTWTTQQNLTGIWNAQSSWYVAVRNNPGISTQKWWINSSGGSNPNTWVECGTTSHSNLGGMIGANITARQSSSPNGVQLVDATPYLETLTI